MKNKSGVLAAAGVYFLWGLLPIYWKAIHQVPALEILGNRVVWSFLFVLLLLFWRRDWQWLDKIRRRPGLTLPFAASSLLLSVNWLVYIWSTINGHIVEASLGYFITPLVNVLLGILFLRERLRPWQWAAIVLATGGVLYLVANSGGLLWISLALALSFGIYGLIRKKAPLGSLESLTVETGILFLPALGYLIYLQATGAGAFGQGDPATAVLLVGAGVVTAVPLLLFGYGAKRVQLTTLGILQYIAPTMQFLLGVLVYGEAFTTTRLIGFSFIWTALAVYWLDSYLAVKRRRAALPAASAAAQN